MSVHALDIYRNHVYVLKIIIVLYVLMCNLDQIRITRNIHIKSVCLQSSPSSYLQGILKLQLLCHFQKPDSLAKLYEMDDSMDRRTWLDKLVSFMDERRTPITSCPTISKNPLDLFRLYIYVKDRGGFMEVCKVQCSSIQPSVSYIVSVLFLCIFAFFILAPHAKLYIF